MKPMMLFSIAASCTIALHSLTAKSGARGEHLYLLASCGTTNTDLLRTQGLHSLGAMTFADASGHRYDLRDCKRMR